MTRINILDGGGPVIADLTDNKTAGLSSSHSISVNSGAPVSNKHVLCVVSYQANINTTARLNAATIGGNSASILRHDALETSSAVNIDPCVAIIGAPVSSANPTLSIGLTSTGGTIAIARLTVYRVRNLLSLTPVAVNGGVTATSGDVASLTRSVDCLKDGLVLAGVSGLNANACTFTAGVTPDFSDYAGAGHHHVTANETGRNVTFARTTSSAIYFALSVVSLR